MLNCFINKPKNHFLQDSKQQISTISRFPMKKIYTHFTAQQIIIDPKKPNIISISSTLYSQIFCFLCILLGFILIWISYLNNISFMILFGGFLSFFIGTIGAITWFQKVTITIDERYNKVIFHKKKPLWKSRSLDIPLSDIKGIQLLSYTMEAGRWKDGDMDVTIHEVNLVFESTNKRQWICSHRKLTNSRDTAEKIATVLGKKIIDHSELKRGM